MGILLMLSSKKAVYGVFDNEPMQQATASSSLLLS